MREIITDLDGYRKPAQTIHYAHTGLHEVHLDKKILLNVMLNLLSNALKYSEKDVHVDAEVSEKSISIRVADQGIGIPAEQQKELFKKFFRANNTGNIQGTGLGLNIVKHYADPLDSSITFISEENKGTAFTLVIPQTLHIGRQAGIQPLTQN